MLDSHRPIHLGASALASDRCPLFNKQKKVIDHREKKREQRSTAPQKSLGPRQLQLLELMHVLRGVFGKLKIAPGGAIPFGDSEIVLINGIEQPAFGFQKAVFGQTVLEL